MKKYYEKPMITQYPLWATNKYIGMPHGKAAICKEIDGLSVAGLVSKFGSPLFVVSERKLREKYRDFYSAFKERYPHTTIAYSYKTNYLSGVCSIFHSEGAWAEVVSGFEYDIALSLKVPAKHIVFNGPYKPFDELERAVQGNSIINVDSFSELNQLTELAAKGRRKIKVGIRLNMNLNYPPWDKFGFNLESGQALEACARIHSLGKIALSGLHIHAGTYLTDYTIYNRAVRNLIDFALHIEKKFDFKIEYLDLGGGYASHNTLLGQFLTASQTIPTYQQYADAICLPLIKAKDKFKHPPRLILEPGRVLVDEAVYLITTVVSTKRLQERINAAIIDAGVNILPTAYWYKHEIEPAQSGEAAFEEVNIYGPLCMQIDVIRTGVRLPPLKFGDMLVIKNVGAYNITQSMQFIYQRPAVVLIHNLKAEYLKRAETTKDMRRLECMPAHLRNGGKDV